MSDVKGDGRVHSRNDPIVQSLLLWKGALFTNAALLLETIVLVYGFPHWALIVEFEMKLEAELPIETNKKQLFGSDLCARSDRRTPCTFRG